jgi:hypothetical protein
MRGHKLGWRDERTDVSLAGAYADTDLTGNGLQEQRFIERDYDSVYTKPDNTRNDSRLLNLSATHEATEGITLSGNAYYRRVKTSTLNGDINEGSIEENVYQPGAAERAALAAAGYTGFPTDGENATNTPFPSWRCTANILTNEEPNEKCNGLMNRSRTRQHDGGFSGQISLRSHVAGRGNLLTAGVASIRSSSRFTQSSQFGFLTSDRGVATVDGPGAFADGSQDSEGAFDARVDLSGDTEVRSVYVTNSRSFALRATHASGRTTAPRSRAATRYARCESGHWMAITNTALQPRIGVTYAPTRSLRILRWQRRQPRESSIEPAAPTGKTPAACRIRWPATRRLTRW